jgi:hypothetical protein
VRRTKFHGLRRKAQGARIDFNVGGLLFSLVPFALCLAPDFYASFLGITSRSKGCGMDLFHQPLRGRFFDSLVSNFQNPSRGAGWYKQALLVKSVFTIRLGKGTGLCLCEATPLFSRLDRMA